MTGLSLGNLNVARCFFRTCTGVSFPSGSCVSIRRTFDVNSPEIVLPRFSSMFPSTASGLNTAGRFRAILYGVEIAGKKFRSVRPDLEDKRRTLAGVSCPPVLVADGPGVTEP